MFEPSIIMADGMRGYYLRILYLITLSLYLNTRKGQHISASLGIWRFELTMGIGLWDKREKKA
jgi:hypothetical protein